jgi:SAM-dependent methyltransferase
VRRFITERSGLFDRVAERYRACGRGTQHYVASKLRRDPVCGAILDEPGSFGDVLDLGCGRGQFGITLLEAGRARSVTGIDYNSHHLKKAEFAGEGLRFLAVELDLDQAQTLLPCDTVTMIDVLYQLRIDAQLKLLGQAAQVARERLLIRTLDPDRGLRSAFSLGLERLGHYLSPNAGAYVNALPVPVLVRTLKNQGFKVSVAPCWSGTPFANVLISARLLPHRFDKGGDVVTMPR